MTKKDYVLIANAINISACNYCGEKIPQNVIHDIAMTLAEVFEQKNPRFNRQKFIEAVYKK